MPLSPSLFDAKLDDAPNYGNTGGTIGHELTHAFDDEGRRFDGDGNLRDWWTKKDAEGFEKRAQCICDQYSQYTIVDDIKINGACTNDRPENMRVNAVVDPHSPPPVRINGVVVNMPESATAFSCKANAKLVKKPQDLCKVW